MPADAIVAGACCGTDFFKVNRLRDVCSSLRSAGVMSAFLCRKPCAEGVSGVIRNAGIASGRLFPMRRNSTWNAIPMISRYDTCGIRDLCRSPDLISDVVWSNWLCRLHEARVDCETIFRRVPDRVQVKGKIGSGRFGCLPNCITASA